MDSNRSAAGPRAARIFGIAIAIGALLAGARASAAAGAGRPNLLMIVLDDVGLGDIAVYGHRDDISTAALDAFAAEGVRFTNFRANGPTCAPSRAALMTGLDPHDAGLYDRGRNEPHHKLRPRVRTLFRILRDEGGYPTSIFGKWHLGGEEDLRCSDGKGCKKHGPSCTDQSACEDLNEEMRGNPLERGFDRFVGFLDGFAPYRGSHGGKIVAGQGTVLERTNEYDGQHLSEVFSDLAIEEIRKRAGSGEPFAIYLAYSAAHEKTAGSYAFIEACAECSNAKGCQRPEGCQRPASYYQEILRGYVPEACDSGAAAEQRRNYGVTVVHLDREVGRVLSALEDEGVRDDTIVIILSDNGATISHSQADTGGLSGEKSTLREGGIVVPMMVRYPAGGLAVGAVSEAFSTTASLLPTVLDLMGVEGPTCPSRMGVRCQDTAPFGPVAEPQWRELAGPSLVAELRDPGTMPRWRQESGFWEARGEVAVVGAPGLPGWKLVGELTNRDAGPKGEDRCTVLEPSWGLFDLGAARTERWDAVAQGGDNYFGSGGHEGIFLTLHEALVQYLAGLPRGRFVRDYLGCLASADCPSACEGDDIPGPPSEPEKLCGQE